MLFPLSLGVLHAMEPDHIAVVTGVSLASGPRKAWRVGLAFGVSHMLAVALLAAAAILAGRAWLGDGLFLWLDRAAWSLVAALGLWNLAAALGLRALSLHSHPHRHGPLTHAHPHAHPASARPLRRRSRRSVPSRHGLRGARRVHLPPAPAGAHGLHHGAAWLGAFFGLGGVRGFTTLLREHGLAGQGQFLLALLLFGLGITATFVALSAAAGWLAARGGGSLRFRRGLHALSGLGNLAVGLYLLVKG